MNRILSDFREADCRHLHNHLYILQVGSDSLKLDKRERIPECYIK
ncbi:hypothetical protein [Bacillus tropicus]|nr:hypothetical protein [Bacillus tropicus]